MSMRRSLPLTDDIRTADDAMLPRMLPLYARAIFPHTSVSGRQPRPRQRAIRHEYHRMHYATLFRAESIFIADAGHEEIMIFYYAIFIVYTLILYCYHFVDENKERHMRAVTELFSQ